MLEKLFKLKEKGTNVRTELVAGLTTFLAMAYILAVNPSILSASGMDSYSVFLATAIASGISCILMGVLANYPVALSAAMGTNAMFAYTLCLAVGYTYQEALAVVFLSGLIFVVISVTGLRKIVINVIPKNMKLAIGAGIGFFVAFIGLQNAGIVVADPSTGVTLGNFTSPEIVLAILGILITLVLVVKKVPAGVFYGLVITVVLGLVMSLCGLTSQNVANPLPSLAGLNFSLNFSMPTLGCFVEGFKTLFTHNNWFIMTFAFLFSDFFDTAGTLVAVGNEIGLVNDKGEIEGVEKALLADSVGTVVGAALGTSTVTSFVESGSGVAAGGRTGLTACTTGILFFLSIVLSPLLSIITSSVTTPALVVVGILMAQQLRDIDWSNIVDAAPAFITIVVMVLGYSIANGIAVGFIVYTLVYAVSGKIKDIHPSIWVLDVIFIISFIV